jgi:predicted nucleic acid-binding protein
MTTYYVDTSALVKRYIDEVGSDWIRTTLSQSPPPCLIVVNLAIVEMTSALARRRRDGLLTPPEYAQVQDAFRSDCLSEYRIVAAVDSIIDEANRLLERYPLRAYDAVHLAAAVVTNRHLLADGLAPLAFLSADDRLNDAALAEGIAVDNPNRHQSF